MNPHVRLIDARRIGNENQVVPLLETLDDGGTLAEDSTVDRREKLPRSRENRRHGTSVAAIGIGFRGPAPRVWSLRLSALSIVCADHAKGQTVTRWRFCASEQQGTPSIQPPKTSAFEDSYANHPCPDRRGGARCRDAAYWDGPDRKLVQ